MLFPPAAVVVVRLVGGLRLVSPVVPVAVPLVRLPYRSDTYRWVQVVGCVIFHPAEPVLSVVSLVRWLAGFSRHAILGRVAYISPSIESVIDVIGAHWICGAAGHCKSPRAYSAFAVVAIFIGAHPRGG